ncbi:MAG: hypothetical protein ACYCO5_15205, partial [Acidobacteriaceae bacterium]
MKLRFLLPRLLLLSALASSLALWTRPVALAATIATPKVTVRKKSKSRRIRATHATRRRTAASRHAVHASAKVRASTSLRRRRYRRHRYYERFTASSYAQDQTAGDIAA